MADQVNPMGNLATGLPSALLVANTPRPAPEKARTAKTTPSQSRNPDDPSSASSVVSAESAVELLNNRLQGTGTELKFKVDRDSGRTLFQVVSENTGEVLLQVPSEEMLAMARKLRDFAEQTGASGVLLDREG